MTKVITTKFNNKTIVSETEIEAPKKKTGFGGRRKAFVHPTIKSMKFNRFDTYEENKQDYYDTLRLVYTGKCKDIFEAYELNR